MNVLVSTIFFYKEELADEFIGVLLQQLAHAARSTGARVRLVVTLNFPFTPALWRRAADRCVPYRSQGVEFQLIERGHNLGFGASHNQVFAQFPSDVFVVINNDLFCEREDWLTAMLAQLGPGGQADLVGTDETRTALRPADGCGVPTADPAAADFMDGSLLGLRSSAVRRLGLFSDSFYFFYFEDSDLFLRYRQAAARIESISVPHRHLRWSGSRQLPRTLIRNILDINRAIFFARWSGYLARRSFSARNRADLRALTPEGCIEALPALIALTRDHPGATLEIALPAGAPPEFFWHPQWQVRNAPAAGQLEDYDRAWTALAIEPQDDLPPVLAHLRTLGTRYPDGAVRDYVRRTASRFSATLAEPPVPAKRAVIVALSPRPRYDGVAAHPVFFNPSADLLRARGYRVVWAIDCAQKEPPLPDGEAFVVGSAADLLQIVSTADVVVGPVGLGLAFAQFLGLKTFALNGAILPDRSLWAWATSGAFSAAKLECLGCQHVWGRSRRSYCLRRDEACIHDDLGPDFARALDEFLARDRFPAADALSAAQRLRLISRQTSSELDLSGWIED